MLSFYSIPQYFRHWKNHFFGDKPYLIKYKDFKMFVRPRTYDFFTIGETMVNEDFKPTIIPSKLRFRTIVDLGANIGDFSVWATKKLKPQKLIAVELEENNYSILLKNIIINNLEKVIVPVRAAIFSGNTEVGVKKYLIKGSMDMLDVEKKGKEKVEAISLEQLFKNTNIKKVDFLKMDIEGSEKFVLTKKNEELFKKRVKYVFFETHKYIGADPQKSLEYFPRIGFKIKVHPTYKPGHPHLIEALNKHFN